MTTKAKQSSTTEMVEMLKAQTKQDKGMGYMWSQSTRAIGTTFGALGTLADAGNQLAVQAKRNTVIANLENSKEICDVLGIEASGLEALTVSDAIVEYICSRR